MESRFLPVRVANKIMFVNIGLKPKLWNDPSFVVVNDITRQLVAIEPEAELLPLKEKISLKPIIKVDDKRQVDGHPVYELTVFIGKDGSKNSKGYQPKYFEVETEGRDSHKIHLKSDAAKNIDDWAAIKINFRWCNENSTKDKEGNLLLVAGKSENVFGNLNIDLGSEATQMAYLSNNEHHNRSPDPIYIDITKSIIDDYKIENKNAQDTVYIQQELKNNKLYKTGKIIYKKEGGKLTEDFHDKASIIALLCDRSFLDATYSKNYDKNKNPFLWEWKTHGNDYKFNSSNTSENYYRRKIQDNLKLINNLKLAYLAPDKSPPVKIEGQSIEDKGILVKLITYIYTQLIKIGAKNVTFPKSRNLKFIRLLLLMPNIYDQVRVNQILQSLNNAINKKFVSKYFEMNEESKNTEVQGGDIVIETHAISESDAALIGYMRSNKEFNVNDEPTRLKANDRILIIDAGKGTLDYSILEYLDKQAYICIDRGGMAGAGQYLTNIFLKEVGRVYCKIYSDKRDLFLKFLEELDIHGSLVMEDFFERLKINHSLTNRKDIRNENFFNEFIDEISNEKSLQAYRKIHQSFVDNKVWEYTLISNDGFIEEKTSKLVKEFVGNLVRSAGKGGKNVITGINYVVLSGRAFEFKLFKNLMRSEVENRIVYKPKRSCFIPYFNKEMVPVKFPKLSTGDELKAKAVNLKRISNFTVNYNTNLMVSFSNRLDQKLSLYNGISIENGLLERFNHLYQANTPLDLSNGEEIDKVYYVGTQTDSPFVLESNHRNHYDIIVESTADYDEFLSLTLFGPGKQLNDREIFWKESQLDSSAASPKEENGKDKVNRKHIDPTKRDKRDSNSVKSSDNESQSDSRKLLNLDNDEENEF